VATVPGRLYKPIDRCARRPTLDHVESCHVFVGMMLAVCSSLHMTRSRLAIAAMPAVTSDDAA